MKVHIALKHCATKPTYVLTRAINTMVVLLGDPGKEAACNARDLGLIPGLEESMATHSSILVWRIPMDRGAWGLQSMGSQRIRHYWAIKHSTAHRHDTQKNCTRKVLMIQIIMMVWSLTRVWSRVGLGSILWTKLVGMVKFKLNYFKS